MPNILIKKTKHHGWDEDHDAEWINEDLLAYSTGLLDDDNEHTIWEEWRLDGKIVKRGVHVRIKKGASTDLKIMVG